MRAIFLKSVDNFSLFSISFCVDHFCQMKLFRFPYNQLHTPTKITQYTHWIVESQTFKQNNRSKCAKDIYFAFISLSLQIRLIIRNAFFLAITEWIVRTPFITTWAPYTHTRSVNTIGKCGDISFYAYAFLCVSIYFGCSAHLFIPFVFVVHVACAERERERGRRKQEKYLCIVRNTHDVRVYNLAPKCQVVYQIRTHDERESCRCYCFFSVSLGRLKRIVRVEWFKFVL